MVQKILEGVKIADFTWALVGPITTNMLSIFGAEVIKIEGRARPDSRRIAAPFKDNIPGLNRSCNFNTYNLGKKSIALNLANKKGIEIAKRIVKWADVVVENFAGTAMERMGLSYAVLKEIKTDIIMLSSSPTGQTGKYPSVRAIGSHLTALSGLQDTAGWPDMEPTGLDSYTDFISPYFNATTILAALDYKRRTGKGQYLDLSQYEDCIHFMAPLVLDFTANHRITSRMGNRSSDAVPHNAYRCLGDDRWCVIAVFNEKEWNLFCNIIDKPWLKSCDRFATFILRKNNEDELDKIIESWTILHSPEDIMTLLQNNGIAAGVVESAEDILDKDPQIAYRGFFTPLDHPEVGLYRAPRSAYILSKIDPVMERAPLIGEHNEYVLKEILALSDEEIGELIVEGIVE